mmetsp:Transcript_54029/g.167675  ORF Transcript_54029/g.167675 Transcript_54029/m.167675 type:complete len:669 (-) Transcript_54029:12-2018(-)
MAAPPSHQRCQPARALLRKTQSARGAFEKAVLIKHTDASNHGLDLWGPAEYITQRIGYEVDVAAVPVGPDKEVARRQRFETVKLTGLLDQGSGPLGGRRRCKAGLALRLGQCLLAEGFLREFQFFALTTAAGHLRLGCLLPLSPWQEVGRQRGGGPLQERHKEAASVSEVWVETPTQSQSSGQTSARRRLPGRRPGTGGDAEAPLVGFRRALQARGGLAVPRAGAHLPGLQARPPRQAGEQTFAVHELKGTGRPPQQGRDHGLVLHGTQRAGAVDHPSAHPQLRRSCTCDSQLKRMEGVAPVWAPTGKQLWGLSDGAVAATGHVAQHTVEGAAQRRQCHGAVVGNEPSGVPHAEDVVGEHATPPAVQLVGHHHPAVQNCGCCCGLALGEASLAPLCFRKRRGRGRCVNHLEGLHPWRGTRVQDAKTAVAPQHRDRDHGDSLLPGYRSELSAPLEEAVQPLRARGSPEDHLGQVQPPDAVQPGQAHKRLGLLSALLPDLWAGRISLRRGGARTSGPTVNILVANTSLWQGHGHIPEAACKLLLQVGGQRRGKRMGGREAEGNGQLPAKRRYKVGPLGLRHYAASVALLEERVAPPSVWALLPGRLPTTGLLGRLLVTTGRGANSLACSAHGSCSSKRSQRNLSQCLQCCERWAPTDCVGGRSGAGGQVW